MQIFCINYIEWNNTWRMSDIFLKTMAKITKNGF